MLNAILLLGVSYCIADFVLGFATGRCVMPGLRCRACKRGDNSHG